MDRYKILLATDGTCVEFGAYVLLYNKTSLLVGVICCGGFVKYI